MATMEMLEERRAGVLEVAQRRGARAVWVIGSVARGEATSDSDVDFLVDFEPGRSLLDQVRLIDELGSLLGIRVDVVAKVWGTWNAKTPVAKCDAGLAADDALLARIEAVAPAERDRFASAMGPLTLGFAQFVGMRLNEHAFHTWDVEVVADPAATIPTPVAELVLDNLELVARYTAQPTGDTTTIAVATTDPERGFTIDLTSDGALFAASPAPVPADIELTAEAFARLVYGRLDPDHTPPGPRSTALAWTRSGACFPGHRIHRLVGRSALRQAKHRVG